MTAISSFFTLQLWPHSAERGLVTDCQIRHSKEGVWLGRIPIHWDLSPLTSTITEIHHERNCQRVFFFEHSVHNKIRLFIYFNFDATLSLATKKYRYRQRMTDHSWWWLGCIQRCRTRWSHWGGRLLRRESRSWSHRGTCRSWLKLHWKGSIAEPSQTLMHTHILTHSLCILAYSPTPRHVTGRQAMPFYSLLAF